MGEGGLELDPEQVIDGIFAVIRLNRKAWLSALALPLLVMILFEATKYVTTWKEYQAKKRKTEAGKTGIPLSAEPSLR